MRLPRLYRAHALLWATLLLAACKSDPSPASPASTAPSAVAPSTADSALPFLETSAYTPELKGRRPFTLFSWTTREQAAELERSHALLTRTESPTRGASSYDHAMQAAADGGDEIATLLRTTAFQKARFAWTNAWATRMGFPGETYGDVLLTITLREASYIARYDEALRTWSVVTTRGEPASLKNLLDQPDRLAAVYFVSDPAHGPAHREFVVCNEAQVVSFSFGMASETGELDAEIAGIEAAARALRDHASVAGTATSSELLTAWRDPLGTGPADSPAKMRRLYHGGMALGSDAYAFDPFKLDAIALSLKAARSAQPTGAYVPLSTPFAGAGVKAPPPKTYYNRQYGTFMTRPGGAPRH